MPHKKPKRTTRERVRNETGADLDPGKDSIRDEVIPKSAARIFNARVIRDEWREKKRKHGEDEDEDERGGKRRKPDKPGNGPKSDKKKISLTIQPGESMQHFNRRVEDDLRPLVKSAAQSARVFARNVAREEHEARRATKNVKKEKKNNAPAPAEVPRTRHPSPSVQEDKFTDRVKEFQMTSSSAPKRLNDIAHAPPEFKQLPRGASSAIGKRDGVLSMSQKVMMEQEREKAIARYRELKARRRQAGDVGDKLEADA